MPSRPMSPGSDEPPIVALSSISFSYPGAVQPVLDHLDLAFHKGERIGLYGPNGSGKTTLLHIIMGLLKPGSGEVYFRGGALRDEKDFRELRLSVGLLLQNADDQLFNPTVLDDVAFGPLNLGMAPGQARDRAVETLESLGLLGFEDRLTHKLSGGEKKLVSLASIMAMRPEAMFLDEPTNGLDPATRERIIEILNGLDASLIIISHDWDFLRQTSKEYRTIKDGRLITDAHFVVHEHAHSHPLGDAPHHHR